MFLHKSSLVKATFTAVLAVLASTSTSFAEGHGPGNGGNAVTVNGKLYLLDLVEAGVQTHPFLGDGKCDLSFTRNVQAALIGAKLPFDVQDALKARLCNLPHLVREQFLAAFALYAWRIIDLPVDEVKGIKSPLDLSHTTVYQVAYRRDRSILIARSIWDQFDLGNKVALIVHELVYAMLVPKSDGNGKSMQESWDAREIVGNIFTESSRYESLQNFTRNGTPMLSIFQGQSSPYTGNGSPGIMGFGVNGLERNYSINYGPAILIRGPNDSPKNSFYFGADASTYDQLRAGTSMIDKYWKSSDVCGWAMQRSKGKVVVEHSFMTARMTLKDYETTEGPTKYVATEFLTTYGQSREISSPEGGSSVKFPGKVELSFSSLADCETRLKPAIVKIAAGIMVMYDSRSVSDYLKPR